MEPESMPAAEREFVKALAALTDGDCVAAMGHLEKALKLYDNPGWYSFLGYCIAKERGQIKKGIELCQASLMREKGNPGHYYNLGRIHLLAGNKEEALGVFRQGIAEGGSPELTKVLEDIGSRKPPVFSFLHRDNPLNTYLGLILSRLGLR